MSVAAPFASRHLTTRGVNALDRLCILTFLVLPVMGVFFAPETYFAPQSFAIPTSPAEPASFLYGRWGYAALLGWIALQAARDPLLFLRGVVQAKLPIVFALYVIASASWSSDPVASVNRSGRMMILVLFAILLAQRCTASELLRLMISAFAIAIAASIIAALALPQHGYSAINGYADAWRGALTHKNALGALMSLGVAFGYYGLATRAVAWPIGAFVLAGSALLAVASRSATSVVAMIALIPTAYFLHSFGAAKSGAGKIVAIAAALLLLLAGGLTIAWFGDIVALTGRSDTFTGRTAVWRVSASFAETHPVFGYGHGFWSMESVTRATIWRMVNWAPPHAHNNFLDLSLQLGAVGLALGVATQVAAIARGVRLLLHVESATVVLWLLVLVWLVLRSLTETTFLDPSITGMFWLTLAYAIMARMTSELYARRRGAMRGRMPRLGAGLDFRGAIGR